MYCFTIDEKIMLLSEVNYCINNNIKQATFDNITTGELYILTDLISIFYN